MSRFLAKERTSAAVRKSRERAKLRSSGRTKIELWITPETKALIGDFGKKLRLANKGVADLIMASAAPLYIKTVTKHVDALLPLLSIIREYEYYGIRPSPHPCPPVRISGSKGTVLLSPTEYHRVLEQVAPVVAILRRYGFADNVITNLVPRKPHPLNVVHPGKRDVAR
jgi:hypothetical protein